MSKFIELDAQSISLKESVSLIKRADYEHYLDAQGLIQKAEKEAQNIIETAENKVEEVKQQGFQAGFEAGLAQQVDAHIHTLSLCKQFMMSRQSDIAELVNVVSKKLINQVPKEEMVMALIERAIESQFNAQRVLLKVHSEQLDHVLASVTDIKRRYPTIVECEVQVDLSVDPGSCIIETPIGKINVSCDSQLAQIESVFKRLI